MARAMAGKWGASSLQNCEDLKLKKLLNLTEIFT
jgi:hypothetical protein